MSDLGGSGPPGRIRPLPVIGGIVLGVVAAVVAQTVLFMALSGLPVFAASPAPMYAVLLFPLLVGVVLLVKPRTRQAGAGLLLGLAVGSIVTAGACTLLTAVLLTNTG